MISPRFNLNFQVLMVIKINLSTQLLPEINVHLPMILISYYSRQGRFEHSPFIISPTRANRFTFKFSCNEADVFITPAPLISGHRCLFTNNLIPFRYFTPISASKQNNVE